MPLLCLVLTDFFKWLPLVGDFYPFFVSERLFSLSFNLFFEVNFFCLLTFNLFLEVTLFPMLTFKRYSPLKAFFKVDF